MDKRFVVVMLMAVALGFAGYTYHQNKKARWRASATVSTMQMTSTPQQSSTNQPAFTHKGYTIKPKATFVIRARVLSSHHYHLGSLANLMPVDLALGWEKMADKSIYQALNISQSNRWYRYSWQGEPPIPLAEIITSSANMHMIAKDEAVEKVLKEAKEGDYIRIKGWLVNVHGNDLTLKSSLTRKDSGAGACEIIFVDAVQIEPTQSLMPQSQ